MFDGYLSFGGVEIVNAARTSAYIDSIGLIGSTGGDCSKCPELAAALGGTAYFTPVGDPAPWYDHNVPESALLAGFQIASVEGTGAAGTRAVSELAAGGAVVGPYRRRPRELVVTFRAVAGSEAAAAYGVAWLSKQLRGSECSPLSSEFTRLVSTRGCGTDVLCMLTACPSGNPIQLSRFRVNLFDVGVTAGPAVVRRQSTEDGNHQCVLVLVDMEVTFTAGDPSWYYTPVRVADVQLSSYFRGTTSYDINASFSELGCGTEVCFDEPPEGCVSTTAPVMAVPPQPCVGATSFTANHYAVPLDFSNIATNMDLVPQLYYTGSEGTPATTSYEGPVAMQIRRPFPGSPCGTVPNPCDVPIEIFTAQQRRQRTGVIDWRRRKAYRTQSTVPVCPYPVFTRQLAPFQWPTLVCADEMCLDVYVNSADDGRGQRIVFDVMQRVDGLA